jgi:Transcription factor WhiB
MNLNDLASLIEHSPDFEWVRHAACGNLELAELDRFFVDAGRSLSSDTVKMCGGCPARLDCLDHAYAHDIAGGYFGGLSPSKRKSLTHEQARALLVGTPVRA